MNIKHSVNTYTSPEHVYYHSHHVYVSVFCRLNVHWPLIDLINKEQDIHDEDNICNELIKFEIQLPFSMRDREISQQLAFAECTAAAYFADHRAFNALGMVPEKPTNFGDLKFVFSQLLSRHITEFNSVEYVEMEKRDRSFLFLTDFATACLFGATLLRSPTVWETEYLAQARPITLDLQQAQSLNKIRHQGKEYQVTARTVNEYANIPIHKKIQANNGTFKRPLWNILRRLKQTRSVYDPQDKQSLRVKLAFGQKAFCLVTNEPAPLFFACKPNRRINTVVGFRLLLSKETQLQLQSEGYQSF
ncbi:hypothetical protein ACPV5V_19505 [Vibrio campbellii]